MAPRIFESYIDALRAQRARREDAAKAEENKAAAIRAQENQEIARRRQEMEIVSRSGGRIRTGAELDEALRMLPEEPRRSLQEVLTEPPPTTGPARPYASVEEALTPLKHARYAEGIQQMANPWATVATAPVPGVDDATLVLPKTYTGMPRVVTQPKAGGGGAFGGGGVTLSKQGIDFAAKMYMQTGTMPPLGMGSAGNRAAVVNRAAELSRNPEGVVDVTSMIINSLETKANSMSFAQLQKQADNIEAFEKTARKNAEVALAAADKVTRSGVPFANRWWQATQRELADNPELAAFDLAVRTFINEYARITTSVTGGGILSDHARKEVEDLLKTAMTPDAFKAAVDTAFMDMENRIKSHAEQFEKIKARSRARTRVPMKSDKAPATQGGAMSKEDFEAWKNRKR